MQRYLVGAAVLALTAGAAQAGGIDRSGYAIGFMFEEGNVLDLSFGSASGSVTGEAALAFDGAASGDMAPSYTQFAIGYKQQINDQLSIGLLLDQPFGADVDYPTGTGYPFQGATASVDSNAVTAIARYKFSDNFAVHGGVRILRTSGQVNTLPVTQPGPPPTPAIYNMSTDTQTDYGYLVGVSYEIPDIALRAALTYNSEITHDLSLSESFTTGSGTLAVDTDMTTVMPKSVNLDFQTGIAANTLLMASVRWVEWTSFDITPTALDSALVEYDQDTTSYTLGVGRKFSDKLSGSLVFGYEKEGGTPTGNLGPTDGYKSVALGVKYQVSDSTAISGGIRHVWVGDATTSTIGSTFEDNTATGFGLRLTHTF